MQRLAVKKRLKPRDRVGSPGIISGTAVGKSYGDHCRGAALLGSQVVIPEAKSTLSWEDASVKTFVIPLHPKLN